MKQTRSMPLISVLLPVHNAADTVTAAMVSILQQSVRDLELIVIDDGSTDATYARTQALRDPRVRVLRNDYNLGISRSLNRALAMADGRFIARMDADDVSHRTRLELQIRLFERQPELGLCGCWVRALGASGVLWRYPETHSMIVASHLFSCAIAHPTVVWRRDHPGLADIQYDPEYDGAEDYDLWSRLAPDVTMANLPRALLDYRMHTAGNAARRRQTVAAIHARTLSRWGLLPTAGQLTLHAAIAEADWPVLQAQLEAIHPWLLALERANERANERDAQIAPAALRRVLAQRYFRVCILATRQGLNGWEMFGDSRFADALGGQWGRRIGLWLRSHRLWR